MTEQVGLVPETISKTNNHLFIFFSGATGGGKALTEIRQKMESKYGKDSILVPSSITTPESLKKDQTQKARLEAMARQIIDKAPQNIQIIGHSFGSYETLDLIRELLEQGYKGNVQVEFVGTPGLLDKGIPALIKFGIRVFEMASQVTMNEQHVFYPLPDNYYQDRDKETSVSRVWSDSSQERKERRSKFIQILSILVSNENERATIIQQLSDIDNQLTKSNEDELHEPLIKKRVAILAPLLQDVFKGKHIDESAHQAFLEYNGETPEQLANSLAFLAQTVSYCGGIYKRIFQGLNKEIALLTTQAQQSNINLKFGFVTLERDAIIKQADLQDLSTEDLANLGMIEQLAHSSMAYCPDPLPAMFTKLNQLNKTK